MEIIADAFLKVEKIEEIDLAAWMKSAKAFIGLDHNNWNFENQVTTSFSLAHDPQHLYLHFDVLEPEVRMHTTTINGPVWEDSCVECFLMFDKTGYYNLEINAGGTMLMAFGPNRDQRTFLSKADIEKIEVLALAPEQQDLFHWQLAVKIPKGTFKHHQNMDWQGKIGKANFYKCGDALKFPHFLSWSKVNTTTPNFHVPTSFGTVKF